MRQGIARRMDVVTAVLSRLGVLWLLLGISVSAAFAQGGLHESPSSAATRSVMLHEAVSPDVTVDGISCDASAALSELGEGGFSTGYGDRAYWLCITVERPGILEISDQVDEADLYVESGGSVVAHLVSGDTRPASARPIRVTRIAFPVADEWVGVPLKLRIVQRTLIVVDIRLVDTDRFWSERSTAALVRAVLIGAVVIMIAFNVAVSLTTRDMTFVLNGATIFSILMLDLYLTGLGPAYLWGEAPRLSNRVLNLSLICPALFGSLFFYAFLADSPDDSRPRIGWLLAPPVAAAALLLVMPWIAYWRVQVAALGLLAIMVSILLHVCTREAWRGNRRAMALMAPLVGSIVPGSALTAGTKLAGVPLGAAEGHVLEVTLVIEALLFSLALAYRIRIAQEERAGLQRNLIDHMAKAERQLVGAVDAERSRIAADLHDTAAQGLVSIVNRLHRMKRRAGGDAELATELDAVAHSSRETVRDLRRISHDLHAVGLGQLGLVRSLAELGERTGAASGMRVRTRFDDTPQLLSEEQSLHVYRIAQELMINAVRHSGGSTCEISLSRADGMATLEVLDDGHGLGAWTNGSAEPGIGLATVSQRVRCLDGHLTSSDRDRGARVTVEFPLTHDEPGKGQEGPRGGQGADR